MNRTDGTTALVKNGWTQWGEGLQTFNVWFCVIAMALGAVGLLLPYLGLILMMIWLTLALCSCLLSAVIGSLCLFVGGIGRASRKARYLAALSNGLIATFLACMPKAHDFIHAIGAFTVLAVIMIGAAQQRVDLPSEA